MLCIAAESEGASWRERERCRKRVCLVQASRCEGGSVISAQIRETVV